MPNVKKIKAQIKSVSNIKQITKALEVVATVKLQKIKQKTEHYREFMLEFLKIVQVINTKTNIYNTSSGGKTNKDLIIVVGTDRGLCGGLNNKLFKSIFTEYDQKKEDIDVFCVGKKTLEFFTRSNFSVVGQTNIDDEFEEEDFQSLYVFLKNSLEERSYRSIKIYFNYFKSAMQQLPLYVGLYPLNKESFESFGKELNVDINDFLSQSLDHKEMILEPSPELLAKEMRKQLLQHIVYGAMLQNKAGELAARMIAMKSATDNSTVLIKDLKLSFNKARQSVITQEVSEIMGAKMALENS